MESFFFFFFFFFFETETSGDQTRSCAIKKRSIWENGGRGEEIEEEKGKYEEEYENA